MYHNNAKTGKWVFYNPEGIIVTECVYNERNDGYDLYNRLGEKISEDSIGKTVNYIPKYRYGIEGLYKSINDEIVKLYYSDSTILEGNVYISGVISKLLKKTK